MERILVVAMETVEKCGLYTLIERCEKSGGDTRISGVKILAGADMKVPVKTICGIMSCRDIREIVSLSIRVDVETFLGENEKFFVLGAILSGETPCILDDTIGKLTDNMLNEYDVKLLNEIKQKKQPAKKATKATKAQPEPPAKEKEAGKTRSESGKEAAYRPSSTEESTTKSNGRSGKGNKPSENGKRETPFLKMLCSKGISKEYESELRIVFEESSARGDVRNGIMGALGLETGGKVLAKLDGSFEKLHELAVAEMEQKE